VYDLLAECGDARGVNVERQVGENRRDLGQKADAIKALYFDNGELVGKTVGYRDMRLDGKGLVFLLSLAACRDHFRQALASRQNVLDHPANAGAATHLVLIDRKLTIDENGVESAAVRGGEYLRVGDIGARSRTGPGDDGQKTRMVGGEYRDFGDRV